MTLLTLERIARALGVSPGDLLVAPASRKRPSAGRPRSASDGERRDRSTIITRAITKASTTSSRCRSGNLARERSDATNASAAY